MSYGNKESFDKEGAEWGCLALAERQHGVIDWCQARRLGLSADTIGRKETSGRWIRLLPGVYRIHGARSSWRQNLMASCLWAGNGAVISHRAAAELWGLRGTWPSIVELTSIQKTPPPGIRMALHRTKTMAEIDVTELDALPVTTVSRTLVDLGAVVRPEKVGVALDDALRRHLTSIPLLHRHLARLGGHGRRGAGVLRSLLEERPLGYVPTHFEFEDRLARAISQSSLPAPRRQYAIYDDVQMVARVDFAYPQVKLAVEADSYTWHTGRAEWKRDILRRNAVKVLGWQIYEVIWDELMRHPDKVVADINKLLCRMSPRIRGSLDKEG
jgi:very-short-patch-repair endonuclease